MLYSEILSSIKTVFDIQILTKEIDLLEQSLYKVGEDAWQNALKNKIRGNIAKIISDDVEWMWTSPDAERMQDYLRGLREKLKQLRIIKLVVAVELSWRGIDRLHDWLQKNVGEGCILDLEVDSGVIGGAKISFGGKYGDFTVAEKWSELFRLAYETKE